MPTTPPAVPTPAPARQQPRLLDRLREALRSRHYSHRTEQCYCHWVKRFIFFHVHETILRRAVGQAAREARIVKHVGCHTFRHSGVYPALCGTTHLLEAGYLSAVLSTAQAGDIRTIQELLGHKDVTTTMIYTHVLNKGGRAVRSPVDGL